MLGSMTNVTFHQSDVDHLPIADRSQDFGYSLGVLHHVPDPAAVLAESARVLRRGARIVICDMLPHEHEEYKHQMGHVWLGFSESQVSRLLGAAGYERIRFVPLSADPEAHGPALFVASAVRQ